ncbi:unnamed protein product [Ectocarpus sp. 4 AP-2014]
MSGNGGEKRKADEMTAAADVAEVPLAELKDVAEKGVSKLGYNEEDTKVICDILMYSQLRGGNQGLIKIITHGADKAPDCVPAEVVHESKLSARLDGGKTHGMLVVSKAVNIAIAKAKEHGFGMVGTSNTSTSTGSIGYYARAIADAGLIAFCFAQSPEFVAPFGAYEALLGTNPIAVGIPREEGKEPIVLDMATAAYPFFGLLEAKTAGKPIPGDVAYDAEGNATTDPAEALKGAIRVFDRSYKGGNLSLIVELLAGPLVRAATTDKKSAKNWGNLVLAVDPELMGDKAEFAAGTETVLARIKGAKKLPGVKDIMLPGEGGSARAAAVLASGVVSVEKNLYDGMKTAAGL